MRTKLSNILFSIIIFFLILIIINLSMKDFSNNTKNLKFERNINNEEIGDLEKYLYLNPDYSIIDFENFDNKNGYNKYIVPNVVHLIYLSTTQINFVQAINIYSILINHNPNFIMIHCDNCSFHGHYWNQINSIEEFRTKIKIHQVFRKNTIFGVKYGWLEHAADTLRLLILMNYGGIYFDNDVYVVKSLNEFRKYEMTVSWDGDDLGIGIQVLIANRNARFLKAHYDTYRTMYNNSVWYYNGGMVPAQILLKHRYLAHSVKYKFGTQFLIDELYKKIWPEWKNLHTIHLLINHRYYLDEESSIKEFDATNIRNYNFTYGIMCRDIINKLKRNHNLDFYQKF